jgi:tRNA(Ile)-lysidine synthase
MIRKILGAVRKQGLFPGGGTVVVAVSGGADSVALLHVLHELSSAIGIRPVVAHLDHRLRRRESTADARFVRGLAKSLDCPFLSARRDVAALAAEHGLSLEMAARDARYAFLRSVARRTKAACVATGHTADDQAETLMLRLARGAGPRGLAGIPAVTEAHGVRVVRPLLGVHRAEIEAFLVRRGMDWREDSSNADDGFLRNRVRHDVLPLLRDRLNPRVTDALCRTAGLLADENDWLEALAADLLAGCSTDGGALDTGVLKTQPAAARRRVVRQWLACQGMDVAGTGHDIMLQLDGLVTGASGSRTLDVPGATVQRSADGLLRATAGKRPAPPPGFRQRLRVPGETLLAEQGLRVVVRRERGIRRPPRGTPGELPAYASLSSAAVGRRALYVRSWKPGDRMRPLGMRGSRKLQDIFVDARVPSDTRHSVPVIECAGEIVWLPGYRVARGWEVPDGAAPALQLDVERS